MVVLWELIYEMDHVWDFRLPSVLLHNRHIDQFHYDILSNAIWYLLKVLHHILCTVQEILLINKSFIHIIVKCKKNIQYILCIQYVCMKKKNLALFQPLLDAIKLFALLQEYRQFLHLMYHPPE